MNKYNSHVWLLFFLFPLSTYGDEKKAELSLSVYFAYPNEAGTKLLIPTAETIAAGAQLTKAICSGSQPITLKHEGFRKEAKDSTSRQNYQNFDKDGGELYSIQGKPISKDATCTLGTKEFFAARTVLEANRLKGSPAQCDAAQKSQLEKGKGRKLMWCKKHMTLGKEGDIVFAQFKKKGKENLAILAFLSTNKAVFEDYSSETGSWRVDDDAQGKFSTESFDILYIYKTTSDKLGLAISWGAPEGGNLRVIEENVKGFKEIAGGYFYWSPM